MLVLTSLTYAGKPGEQCAVSDEIGHYRQFSANIGRIMSL